MIRPRFTIITPTFNSLATLEQCQRSIYSQQDAGGVQHLIMDGGSSDGTPARARALGAGRAEVHSGPDRGMYDAINKGIALARGELVGVLNSDDHYADSRVLRDVSELMSRQRAGALYGDLEYVRDAPGLPVVRHWRSGPYDAGRLARGWMPPHPTFFVRRELYQRLGGFRLDLDIAADYELMLRFLLRGGTSACYLPRVMVRMRTGGASNRPANLLHKSREDMRAWRLQGRSGAPLVVLLKNLRKLPQFIGRRPPLTTGHRPQGVMP